MLRLACLFLTPLVIGFSFGWSWYIAIPVVVGLLSVEVLSSRLLFPSIQVNHNVRLIKKAPKGAKIYLGEYPGVIADYYGKIKIEDGPEQEARVTVSMTDGVVMERI
ncbi:MAG TPA: hypothetical protein VGO63_00155 [Candidatus Paceibacterota bacterium]|nr:hypothetical protein [Candidatus Paceibacterota bacterium]